MKTPAEKYGIDLFYLRRSKEMTPGARLNWLAAAREFSRMLPKPVSAKVVKTVRSTVKKGNRVVRQRK